DSVDRWFWADFSTLEKFVLSNSPQDFPIELPGVSTSGGTATVTVALRGFTDDKLHQMRLSINSTQIAQKSWQGQDEYRVEATIDQGLLISGINTITIELVGTELDGLVLDWIEVGYLRSLDAIDDVLRFTSDPGSLFEIQGFTENTLSAFDITDPLDVGRIQGVVVTPDAGTFTLEFQGQGGTADHTYIALGESQIRGALEIAQKSPPTLTDTRNGADYILITHRDIGWELDGTPAGWLSDLVEYRQSQGLRVMAVDIREIYDGFNYGISDPQAVKDFLSYAYHNWQPPAPQYVLLVGDTTYDPKGNFAPPGPTVPTYLGWTRYMGETAIDDWFVQIVGPDALGDLSLGRLPAADKAEAQIMVGKIISYEEAPRDQLWQKRLLLIADDREPIFEQMNEAIAGLIPTDYSLIKGYLEDYKLSPAIPPDLTAQIIAEIKQGVLIVNYAGHGSPQYWAHERIFRTTHIPGLSNGQRLPVMVLMTCLNGYFVMPTSRSFAEEMLLADGAGAVAAFAPTGMTDAQVQKLLDQGFTEAVFQTGIVLLGEAVHAAKQTLLVNTTGQQDTANSFSLMGDPAMTLPVEISSGNPAITAARGGGGSGGCFIASAAYGSFLDEHVNALRNFRDTWLTTNTIGKYLIQSYYTLSPPAAQWIKGHQNIRTLTRIALIPMVAIAQLEIDRALVICLVLLMLLSPLAWMYCLTKGRKRAFSKE
ncbi:MAG: C25 family cysteine peptidase, partial [Anaerolineae bacterium]